MAKHKKEFIIPIYNARVWLIVAEEIHVERKALSKVFGDMPGLPDYSALCSDNGRGSFALFFKPLSLTANTMAHEIFHLTHRILEWAGDRFDSEHHEQGAHLCGYLTALVSAEINRLKSHRPIKTKKRQRSK